MSLPGYPELIKYVVVKGTSNRILYPFDNKFNSHEELLMYNFESYEKETPFPVDLLNVKIDDVDGLYNLITSRMDLLYFNNSGQVRKLFNHFQVVRISTFTMLIFKLAPEEFEVEFFDSDDVSIGSIEITDEDKVYSNYVVLTYTSSEELDVSLKIHNLTDTPHRQLESEALSYHEYERLKSDNQYKFSKLSYDDRSDTIISNREDTIDNDIRPVHIVGSVGSGASMYGGVLLKTKNVL